MSDCPPCTSPLQAAPQPAPAATAMGTGTIVIIAVVLLVLLIVVLNCCGRRQPAHCQHSVPATSTLKGNHPPPSLPSGTQGLFTSGKYSDLKVVCGNRTWKLHKAILCTQSEFFAKACDGPFREAKEDSINLKDDDQCAVAAMLHYLYNGDYEGDLIAPLPNSASLLHVRVYMMADRYFIHHLREKALVKLSEVVKTAWKTSGFTDVVEEIYAITPTEIDGDKNELRETVLAVAKQHASTLFGPGKEYSKFKEMAWSIPGFAADVTRAVACSTPDASAIGATLYGTAQLPADCRYYCPRCRQTFSATISDLALYTHGCPWNAQISHMHPYNSMYGSQWRYYQC